MFVLLLSLVVVLLLLLLLLLENVLKAKWTLSRLSRSTKTVVQQNKM